MNDRPSSPFLSSENLPDVCDELKGDEDEDLRVPPRRRCCTKALPVILQPTAAADSHGPAVVLRGSSPTPLNPSAPRTMDPYQNQGDSGHHLGSGRSPARLTDGTSGTSGAAGSDPTPGHPGGDAPDGGTPAAADRRPQHSGGFTVIPPDESRRSKMKMMAQKEEEDLQRWKEAHRAPPVHLDPEKLGGGAVSLDEARDKQLRDLRSSKLQRRLRKEDLDRRRRREEEEENQKKKDVQREKAERQEEKRRQEDQRRREQLGQDHFRTNAGFLQRFDTRATGPPASSSATHTSRQSEAAESKQSVREVQLEHRRVNAAFLDKLEARGSETEAKGGGVRETEYRFTAIEDFRQQPSSTHGQQLPLTHLSPDPDQSCSDWTEEADPDPDYDWALMKLMNSFPDFSRVFLEDILDQFDGDHEQAHALLISTLS